MMFCTKLTTSRKTWIRGTWPLTVAWTGAQSYGGIEKLKEIKFYRPQSELEKHRTSLEDYFHYNTPATINEAVNKIEELTGIKRSPTQIRKFLKSMGMRCLKVGALPAKADPDQQEKYKTEQLEPRLEEAKQGKRAVFFVDAAHC